MADESEIETYTPERIAEFLLNNAANEQEYRDAIAEVLTLGVDPLAIDPKYLFRDRTWQRAELYLDERRTQRSS